MHQKNKIWILIIIGLLFFSCYEDQVFVDETEVIQVEYPEESVSGIVITQFQDENGKVIAEVESELSGQIFNSAEEGVHFYHSDLLNQYGSKLALKINDNKHLFTIYPLQDEVNYFHSSIFTTFENFQAESAEKLQAETQNGFLINIAQNSYLKNGQKYEGEVLINWFDANLSDPFHLEGIPSGHLATDQENHTLWIDYDQVFYIDIQGELGEALHFSEAAQIHSPVSLCQSCSFWFFEEQQNRWIEIENASPTDSAYLPVSKSGYYAIAEADNFHLVQGSVSLNEQALIHHPVDIFQGEKLLERVYTTNQGKWLCALPFNRDFNYQISFENGDQISTDFSSRDHDIILDHLNVDTDKIQMISLNSEVFDCDDEAIKEYFYFLKNNDLKHFYYTEGDKPISIPENILEQSTIKIVDAQLFSSSPWINFIPTGNAIDLRRTYACNEYREGYFKLIIDGKERIFTVMESRLDEEQTRLIVYDEINLISEIQISFDGSEPRNYNDEELKIVFDRVNIDGSIYEIQCENSEEGCGFNEFEIFYYGSDKGDWIQGSFSGEFWVKSYEPVGASYKNVSGIFLVPRNFS